MPYADFIAQARFPLAALYLARKTSFNPEVVKVVPPVVPPKLQLLF